MCITLYVCVYKCVCVCASLCERERERVKEKDNERKDVGQLFCSLENCWVMLSFKCRKNIFEERRDEVSPCKKTHLPPNSDTGVLNRLVTVPFTHRSWILWFILFEYCKTHTQVGAKSDTVITSLSDKATHSINQTMSIHSYH